MSNYPLRSASKATSGSLRAPRKVIIRANFPSCPSIIRNGNSLPISRLSRVRKTPTVIYDVESFATPTRHTKKRKRSPSIVKVHSKMINIPQVWIHSPGSHGACIAKANELQLEIGNLKSKITETNLNVANMKKRFDKQIALLTLQIVQLQKKQAKK